MRLIVLGVLLMAAAGMAAEVTLVEPKVVADQLAKGGKPVIIQIGPNSLFRARRIPGAIYAGQAARPDGLELLKQTVLKLPRDREILLYCGCCPWDVCPNVKPAIALMQQLGFTRTKVIHMATNFAKDWTERGYPVEPAIQK
jgi:thiosulfate/3-mercaptopyruvate sulfurtransferase